MRSALALAAVLPLALGACARAPVAVPELVKPYRITIQQGNYVTREMVEQLKPGMTKEQVRFILGTPLLTDIFHADRWDYVYYLDAPGGRREQRTFTVIFEDGRLARAIGDLLPSAPAQAGAKPAPAPQAVTAPPAAAASPRPAEPEAARPSQSPPEPAGEERNRRAASDPEPGAVVAAPEAEAGRQPAEAKAEATAQDKPARGFFGRILERIGF